MTTTQNRSVDIVRMVREGYSVGQTADRLGLSAVEVREALAAAELSQPRPAQPRPVARPARPQMIRPVQPAPPPPHIVRPTGQQETVRIRAGQLFVDEQYQRDLNLRWVLGKVKEYDPKLLGVLEVSERPDGRYAVVDGRHRLELIKNVDAAGDNATALCHVHRGLTIEQEAELFGRIDSGRRRLSAWDRWKAARAAGDPTVIAIEKAAADAGLRLVNSTSPRHNTRRAITSTVACRTLVDLAGVPLLREAMHVAVTAWNTDRCFDRYAIESVGLVLHHYTRDEIGLERLIDACSSVTLVQLRALAAAMREHTKGSNVRLAAATLVGLVNDRRGTHGAQKVPPFLTRLTEGEAKPA